MAHGFWVFGYGSLIWNPGFEPQERVLARLDGYSRSFCMWSIHHRGRPEAPGLVLALDEGAEESCEGVAFSVPAARSSHVLAQLRERELISSAYVEHEVGLSLADGRRVQALAYVVARDHVQYARGLPLDRQAEIIARAHGDRGPNAEYLFNTVAHLAELGIRDPELETLGRDVARHLRSGTSGS